MWRSRARLGLCAIVMALAWPAVPAVAVAGVAQPDEGTLQVSPTAVQASTQTPLTISFTEPASPPSAFLIVTVSMPPGWTAVPPSSSDLGGCAPDCSLAPVSAEVFEVVLTPGASAFTLNVLATPPGFATSSSFTAEEQFHSPPPNTFEVTAPVAVACPTDGLGTIQVAPASVPAATGTNFTFTYTAGSCGAGDGGTVTVTVPPGWTQPIANAAPGTPGLVTWAGSPPVLVVAGSTIVVPVGNLAQGTVITFEYDGAQAPGSAVPYTFAAGQAASGEPAQPLVSPTVTVAVATTTSPSVVSSTSPSVLTSTPSPQSPSPGPATVTATPTRSTASLRSTLAGAAGGQPTNWMPFLLVVVGLVLVAGTAGLAAFRPLRRGGHGAAAGDVRAVPHTGPPPSVAVRDTENRPALTVRLEPRAGATVTTIEEGRP